MIDIKPSYEDFIAQVPPEAREFVESTHAALVARGCALQIKEAKSGYVVSYLRNKKTLINYVFRKKGLMMRIYAAGVGGYMDFFETLPQDMRAAMEKAPDCRRMLNPEACTSRCPMGYDYLLDGKRQQKCRNGAFMFLVDESHAPHLQAFVEQELGASA